MTLRTFFARRIVLYSERVLNDCALVVDARGQVVEVIEGFSSIRRRAAGEVVDLGEGVLAPGWVNAHAHLELTRLSGRVQPGAAFPDWIKSLLKERAGLEVSDYDAGVKPGADQLLRGGTTTVGDVDSTGASVRALKMHPIRALVFREALDVGDAARCHAVLAELETPLVTEVGFMEGISPHAGYTVSDRLLAGVAELALAREVPVQVHWNESLDEVRWERGESSAFDGVVPDCAGGGTLRRLDEIGLLGKGTSLVHANYPAVGDLELIAARGAVVVHCPGAHAFFGRSPFDLGSFQRAVVPVALGTDSLAGNAALDMGLEVALLREANQEVSAAIAFEMGTRASAAALGLSGRVGTLEEGAYADMVLYRRSDEALEMITSGGATVERVWVGGVEQSLSS